MLNKYHLLILLSLWLISGHLQEPAQSRHGLSLSHFLAMSPIHAALADGVDGLDHDFLHEPVFPVSGKAQVNDRTSYRNLPPERRPY